MIGLFQQDVCQKPKDALPVVMLSHLGGKKPVVFCVTQITMSHMKSSAVPTEAMSSFCHHLPADC